MQKLVQYLKDVKSELIKVSWPTTNELTGATILVIILSIILALYVKVCDMAVGTVMRLFIQYN